MKDLTKIFLGLSVFLVVSSIVIYQDVFELYDRGGQYPDIEHFMGSAAMLLISACFSLIASVIEVSKENKYGSNVWKCCIVKYLTK